MATYDYEIVNLALVRLGANRISSLTDGTKNANEANAIYDLIRDEILRDHPWGFSVRYGYLELQEPNVLTIWNITQASPGVVTYTGTDPEAGDRYTLDNVVGMTEVNDEDYIVQDVDPVVSTELVTNGTMEADTSWTSVATPTTQERSTTQYHGGLYSRYFVADGAGDGIRCTAFSTTTGKWYYCSGWVYPSITTVTLKAYRGAGGATLLKTVNATVTANTWNFVEMAWKETIGGASAYISITLGGVGNVYCDDFSVYQAGTFSLHTEAAAEVDTTTFTAYTSDGDATFYRHDDHEFAYAFYLPSTTLRVLEINHDPDEDFEVIENNVLVSNSDEVEAKIIHRVTDITKYDPTFVNTFAWRLAMELAMPITGDTQKATFCSQMYNFWSARAKATDASQGRDLIPKDSRYVDARR